VSDERAALVRLVKVGIAMACEALHQSAAFPQITQRTQIFPVRALQVSRRGSTLFSKEPSMAKEGAKLPSELIDHRAYLGHDSQD